MSEEDELFPLFSATVLISPLSSSSHISTAHYFIPSLARKSGGHTRIYNKNVATISTGKQLTRKQGKKAAPIIEGITSTISIPRSLSLSFFLFVFVHFGAKNKTKYSS